MNRRIVSVLAGLALAQASGEAAAQSRQFQCGDGTVLTLKVLNASTIAAGPVEGRTVALKQTPGQPLTFAYREVRLDIAPDQASVSLSIPGGDSVDCVYRKAANGAASAAGDTAKDQPRDQPRKKRNPAGGTRPPADGSGGTASAAAGKGVVAKSWGGIVRAGPGLENRKLASLKEGDPITLLENSRVEMDGYPWFKIRFGGDSVGYQWGGIICSVGRQVPGTFETCD